MNETHVRTVDKIILRNREVCYKFISEFLLYYQAFFKQANINKIQENDPLS